MWSFRRAGKIIAGNQGFTLLEILMAISIVLILIAVTTPIVLFTVQTSHYNRVRAESKNIANEKIEEIRAMQFSDLEVGHETNLYVSGSGKEYTVDIYVNWEEESESGCLGTAHAEWDAKSVRVVVSSVSYTHGGYDTVKEEMHTFVARDYEQPLYTGANIRVCVFRGWDYSVSIGDEERDYVPVEFTKVEIEGLENKSLFTTAKGAALFMDISEGDYTVNISNPSNNMISFPGSYPKSDITASDGSTKQLFAYVEKPGSLALTLKDIEGQPIIINKAGFHGSLTLEQPYGGEIDEEHEGPGLPIEGIITGSDGSGNIIPADLFTGLWPFPDVHANAYSFQDINIPGYLLHLKGVWDIEHDEAWKGYFDEPNQSKDLGIYLWEIPEIAEPAGGGDWLIADSVNINYKSYPEPLVAHEEDNDILIPAVVQREHTQDSLILPADQEAELVATHMLFRGEALTVQPDATLFLNANIIGFEGEIEVKSLVQNTGNIVLHTLNDQYEYSDGEETVIVNVVDAPETVTGMDIEIPRGFSGPLDSPWSGKEYGIVYFEQDVIIDGDVVINSGAYYFPDGFNFYEDGEKAPGEGGLIRFAE